jgi:hypothetical protein
MKNGSASVGKSLIRRAAARQPGARYQPPLTPVESSSTAAGITPEGPNCDGMKPPLPYGRATPVRLGFLPWVKLLYLLFDRMIHTLWR